jgi:hypothetical protein
MAVIKQKNAEKGSQFWIQKLVNENPNLLSTRINQVNKTENDPIIWQSPKKEKNFVEYSDDDFISVLRFKPEELKLNEFWPKRGPNWDCLGISNSGNRFLVEAKSHIQEMVSPPSRASKPSIDLIKMSLKQTQDFCKANENIDWSSCFFQYFNRLAHLKFLRFDRTVAAYLVFLYFVNDTSIKNPASEVEWKGAIELFKSYAGIKKTLLSRYIIEVFIDVNEM